MKLRWLGVAGLEFTVDDQVLVVDPFFSRFPLRRMWAGQVKSDPDLVARYAPRCDFVLVSHTHWDHVMDVPDIVRNTGAEVFGSSNTWNLLVALGVPVDHIRVVAPGDGFSVGSFQVDVYAGRHDNMMGFPFATGRVSKNLRPPLRAKDYKMDSCFSFLIVVGETRCLVWNNTRPGPAVEADILFIAPGKGPGYYRTLLSSVRPKMVVPIHWDDLFRPLSEPIVPYVSPPSLLRPWPLRVDLNQFSRMIDKVGNGANVLVPKALDRYTIMFPG
jgi:L-ascorbate metabolism protein UlaG (beta-lactamase superfamily)